MGWRCLPLGGVVAAMADSMPLLIAGRALQGCGAIAGVAMALAADLTRPERRPVIMAIIGIGIGGAFLLSMGLSVPLATLLGLQGLFWLTVVFAIAGMGLVMTIPRTQDAAVKKPGTGQAAVDHAACLAAGLQRIPVARRDDLAVRVVAAHAGR